MNTHPLPPKLSSYDLVHWIVSSKKKKNKPRIYRICDIRVDIYTGPYETFLIGGRGGVS